MEVGDLLVTVHPVFGHMSMCNGF